MSEQNFLSAPHEVLVQRILFSPRVVYHPQKTLAQLTIRVAAGFFFPVPFVLSGSRGGCLYVLLLCGYAAPRAEGGMRDCA